MSKLTHICNGKNHDDGLMPNDGSTPSDWSTIDDGSLTDGCDCPPSPALPPQTDDRLMPDTETTTDDGLSLTISDSESYTSPRTTSDGKDGGYTADIDWDSCTSDQRGRGLPLPPPTDDRLMPDTESTTSDRLLPAKSNSESYTSPQTTSDGKDGGYAADKEWDSTSDQRGC